MLNRSSRQLVGGLLTGLGLSAIGLLALPSSAHAGLITPPIECEQGAGATVPVEPTDDIHFAVFSGVTGAAAQLWHCVDAGIPGALLSEPTWQDHLFMGWFLDPDGVLPFDPGASAAALFASPSGGAIYGFWRTAVNPPAPVTHTLALSPGTAEPGDSIDVTMTGIPGGNYSVRLDQSAVGSVKLDAQGAGSVSFTVPEDTTFGLHTVDMFDGAQACAEETIDVFSLNGQVQAPPTEMAVPSQAPPTVVATQPPAPASPPDATQQTPTQAPAAGPQLAFTGPATGWLSGLAGLVIGVGMALAVRRSRLVTGSSLN